MAIASLESSGIKLVTILIECNFSVVEDRLHLKSLVMILYICCYKIWCIQNFSVTLQLNLNNYKPEIIRLKSYQNYSVL